MHTRINDLGSKYRVDAHATAAPLRTQLAGHLDHCAHGHAVGDTAATERRDTRHRTEIDDAPSAGCQHSATSFLAATKTTVDETPPCPFDIVQGHVFWSPADGFPGDVGNEIDAAEMIIDPIEHRTNLLGFGYVAHHRQGLPHRRFDLSGRCQYSRFVDVGQHDVGACLRQGKRRCFTQTAGRTGHQRDTAGEFEQVSHAHFALFILLPTGLSRSAIASVEPPAMISPV